MKKTVGILVMAVMLISMCGFTSTEVNAATKVTLSRKSVSVSVGCSTKLQLNNAVSTVKWKSANPSIATVSKRGTVTGVRQGATKISATYRRKTYSCKVKVNSSRISVEKRTLPVGQSYQLWVVKRMPKDNETVNDVKVSSNVTWKSSDNRIAQVNKNGLVMARAEGMVEITAKTKGESYTCIVSVVKALGYDDFAYNPKDEMAETYEREWNSWWDKWTYQYERTDIAREYSHFSGLLKEAASYNLWWYRCYSNSLQNQENRGVVIGNTIDDVWEKYGQADGAINQGPKTVTNWYSCSSSDSLKGREGITSKMTYSYKDTSNSDIVEYEKNFYFDQNNTLILIEWRMTKK